MTVIIKEKDLKRVQGHCGSLKKLLAHVDNEGISMDLVDIKNSLRHFHKNSKEFYFVVKGRGEIEINKKRYSIKEGDLIVIPPKTIHSAIPRNKLKVLVIGIPPVKSDDNYIL